MLKADMLNQMLTKIVSSSLDVSKVRKLYMKKYQGSTGYAEMSVDGDSLSLKGSESLVESVFMATIIHHLTSLQEINMFEWLSVVSFPANCLPKSLQKLRIYNCSKMEFPEQQQQHKYDLVELLVDSSCDSLASLSLDAFPNLKNLKIEWCSNLESISMSETPHTALQSLTINDCPKVVSITEGGLAAPNLTHLNVSFCDKLEALPRKMDTLAPNLQSLDIEGCGGICRFPEGGLPPNLQKLYMKGYEGLLRSLSSMEKLEALTHLVINGYESRIKSFPEVGTLPHLPSLTNLSLSGFRNLETLECDELLRLTSLQHLYIDSCEKLENMAGGKLLSSLLLLQIEFCPLLEEGCKNKHQHIWPKIQHIPTITVNGSGIFTK
ncbi:hypothetical protein PIB30_022742 [Stylosanthes scabra]|uniref:Uncharacterized protein n=1 Tax=Stylosanthes scabra TaxID=79078 RepID=A0ABU6Z7T5_9FABA|nr:hypothetical protein [Stylosanthes scabra]